MSFGNIYFFKIFVGCFDQKLNIFAYDDETLVAECWDLGSDLKLCFPYSRCGTPLPTRISTLSPTSEAPKNVHNRYSSILY